MLFRSLFIAVQSLSHFISQSL